MTRRLIPLSSRSRPEGMRVFLSYRRGDCQPQANAISDGLRHRIDGAHIFMDLDSIPPGADFEEHIRGEIQVCDVVLVLIGDEWLSAAGPDGSRRLDSPDDLVRLEVESALASPQVRLVPVLVEGAAMPQPAELPEPIRALARINAIELSDQRWATDIERLADVVRQPRVPAPEPVSQAPVPEGAAPSLPPFRIGTVMVFVPLLSFGLLSFVPSLWVASRRRGDRPAMIRSLAAAAVFLAGVASLATAIAFSTDAQGTLIGRVGQMASVLQVALMAASTVLAFVQRHTPRAAAPGP